jgi:hypothetical protein
MKKAEDCYDKAFEIELDFAIKLGNLKVLPYFRKGNNK